MKYITTTDIKARLQDKHLQQIVEQDMDIVTNAETTAIAVITDALYPYYDAEAIFAKRGADRDATIVRWVTTLILYYIHERIPDKLVPERVVKNYDDTMHYLLDVADGKKSVKLPTIDKDGDGLPDTKFRHGSIHSRYSV